MNLYLRLWNSARGYSTYRVLKALFDPKKAVARSSHPEDTLFRRLSRTADCEPSSVVSVLEKWREEGKAVTDSDLKPIIVRLRKAKRWKHALKISNWMAEEMNYKFSSADIAVRLDLISKINGLEEALKYFDGIPEHLRDFKVYGALLACYAHEHNVEKAEDIMQKIRESGLKTITLHYNVMLKLYSQTKQYEKMDILMQEMIESDVDWDNYTYNLRLSAYAESSDIKRMEKLLKEMEIDPITSVEWNSYVAVANGYSKSGMIEKASTMLKRAERILCQKKEKHGYKILISLYAGIGDKDEVYRLWDLYKRMGNVSTTCFFTMITSLVRLDDVAGVERILEEWDCVKKQSDVRLPRVLIDMYCKKGMLQKAEVYLNTLVETGNKPHSSLWDRLAHEYQVKKHMPKALENLKRAVSASSRNWNPHYVTLVSCLEYLKKKGHVESALEILSTLRQNHHLQPAAYDGLVSYINDKDKETRAIDKLKRLHSVSRKLHKAKFKDERVSLRHLFD